MSKKPVKVLWCSLLIVVLSFGTLGLVRTHVNSSQSRNNRLEAESITVRDQGFEPASLSRPPGRFLIAVDNRSHSANLELQILQVGSNARYSKQMRGKQLRWREVIELPVGEFILTETNHPAWRCQITISPK